MSEYLSEEEQLAQLKGWWSRYGWWLVAAVVLGLGGYFFLQYLEDERASTNAAASEVFERYQENPSDEALAKPLLERLDSEFAGTAYQIMSLMTRAQLATSEGDIEAAVGFYTQATQGEDVAHITDVARLRLARALQQQNRSDEAIKALSSVKGEGYRSLVAELKGDILAAQGDAAGARQAYAAAVEAQGDNPRVLLSMKLANYSAPEGSVADAGASDLNEDAESESESDTGEAPASPETFEGGVEGGVEGSVEGAVVDALEAAEEASEEELADIEAAVDSAVDSATEIVSDAASTTSDN